MAEPGEDDDQPEKPGGEAGQEQGKDDGAPCYSHAKVVPHHRRADAHGGEGIDLTIQQHRDRKDADGKGEAGKERSDQAA